MPKSKPPIQLRRRGVRGKPAPNQFIISAEGGSKGGTEFQYFKLLEALLQIGRKQNGNSLQLIVVNRRAKDSSPEKVLRGLEDHIEDHNMIEGDQAWLVIDKNHWEDSQIQPLHDWTVQQNGASRKTMINRGLALSNPCFECWLLLHFDDKSPSVEDCNEYKRLLREHLPDYDKNLKRHRNKFTRDKIVEAVKRAKTRDRPPCKDWPRTPGVTTVYRLVEKLFPPRP